MKVLITGATSGIGYLSSLTLANLGHSVYLTCHKENEVSIIKEKVKNYDNIKVLKIDITSSNDRKKVLDLNVDRLICNAAVCQGGSIIEANLDKFRDNYEVNVLSNFTLIQEVLQQMIKKNNGRIIVISSIAANVSMPFIGIYSSTKASISNLTKSLQKELSLIKTSVKVVLVEPGLYHTGFNQVFLDNKYNNGPYFKKIKYKLYNIEHALFNIIEKKNLDSIVIKIVKSVITKYPKRLYRAPFFQTKIIKFYSIFD